MFKYADLELSLRHRDANSYDIDFRYKPPDSAAESHLGNASATIDLKKLDGLAYDQIAYGKELTDSLFADSKATTAFLQALASAETLGVPIRFRLFIDPGAHILHSLRWETLLNPKDGSQLCTTENLLFSRYVRTPDFRLVRLRLKI